MPYRYPPDSYYRRHVIALRRHPKARLVALERRIVTLSEEMQRRVLAHDKVGAAALAEELLVASQQALALHAECARRDNEIKQ